MPLTRKQAWRRVRVRQELGETKDDSSPRCCKRSMVDKMNPTEGQQQEGEQEKERSSPERTPKGGSAIKSPEREVLDKWRLPKEGREPSARAGVSASKRQAAAACVRVGSRVSFNTVVAAILIPSAKDLHAAARRELWWQETDYRDFRMNFIQFMRNPPIEDDDLEMSPADIAGDATMSELVADDGRDIGQEEEKQMTVEDLPQPVMVSAIVFEDSAPCDAPAGAAKDGACAWGAEENEAPTTAATTTVSSTSSSSSSDSVAAAAEEIVESDIQARVLAAAATATAGAAAAASNNIVAVATPPTAAVTASATAVEFSSPAAAAAAPVNTLIVEEPSSEATTTTTAGFCSHATEIIDPRTSSTVPTVMAPPACDANDYTVGDEGDANPTADGGGCWDEQETNRRMPPSLPWAPTEDNTVREEVEEEDGDDNTIRVRRSFSNLETARRQGAGHVSAATGEDPSDSDDGGEEGASRCRPRALSLDGWFTCGLENDVETKSYETHDHAGRLRELVTLPPFPAMIAATPPPPPSPKPDLTEAMRQLRVTFNVSVNEDSVAGKQGAGMECKDCDSGGDMLRGETKCRAEEEDAMMGFPSAAASRNFSEIGAMDSRPIGNMAVGSALNGLQPDYDVCVA